MQGIWGGTCKGWLSLAFYVLGTQCNLWKCDCHTVTLKTTPRRLRSCVYPLFTHWNFVLQSMNICSLEGGVGHENYFCT